MNYLFLLNSCILLFLGGYLHASKNDKLSFRFLILSLGIATWNICIFLVEEIPLSIDVDFVARIQLIASMVFNNAIMYFCSSYPLVERKHHYLMNALCFVLLSSAMLFTNYITQAKLVNGIVIYTDSAGFIIYGVYMIIIAITAFYYLSINNKQYLEYRDRIKYLFIGLGVFGGIVLVFNIILPSIGIYNWLIVGRLSSILPALFFAYAITKYDFMDISVIINRKTAWILVNCIITLSFILAYQLSSDKNIIKVLIMSSLGIFWTFYGISIHNFLLTSARRKFVRSWYNTEDLISEISNQITAEKNREAIFITIEKCIDEAFQLEQSEIIFSVRDDNQRLSHYVNISRSSEGVRREELQNSSLIDSYALNSSPAFFDECDAVIQKYLLDRDYKSGRECIVIPFYSPEHIEGIIVVGERSTQEPYLNRDMKFFVRLVNYMSAILYRLTPFEKLERQYFDNRQKLHEAEIQLIRAQKIESILHATRQCHHEIRTPLNIIRLGIGRIKTLADLDSYAIMVKEEIARAIEIVEETLVITDVSQSSKDKIGLFDINEVLQRCSRLVDSGRFQLSLKYGEVPQVEGVFSDIQVVITNLLHNAMDAMPEGGAIRMSSFFLGEYVVIEVEDTGSGIAKELRSKVWEPYFSGSRVEEETLGLGNSNAGRGWGLTIVNRIVNEHHGVINFTSTPGQGTKFTINLPFHNKHIL